MNRRRGKRTYPVRITAPSPDILLDPFERFELISQTQVRSAILGNLVAVSVSISVSSHNKIGDGGDSKEALTRNLEYQVGIAGQPGSLAFPRSSPQVSNHAPPGR